jgi:large subunit ribosomal protein L17
MRHRVAGRHLGRDTAHRTALYRNLVTDLLRHERITTTEAKAKEIRPMAERIITLGRRGDLHARRQASAFLYDTAVVKKVFDEIGPRMKDRPGGYLRITGIEPRKGDGARMASIELMGYVEAPPTPRPNRVTAAPVAEAPAPRTRGRKAAAVEAEAVAEAPAEEAMAESEAAVEAEAETPAEAEQAAAETPTDAPEAEGDKA